jgi:tetratricopeptide (TPR) repeat protein
MKKSTLLLGLVFTCSITFSQNKEEAEKLVSEGVAYHDKGDFEGAIVRYDKALQLDKDNLPALTEKAYSLMELKKYDEAITLSKQAIAAHPKDPRLKTVYVNYGTAYDLMKKTDKSIEIYEEGIKEFPNYYLLHFNKAISLISVKRYKEGQLSFQQAVVANPEHAGSHSGIGRMSQANNKAIPALLAFARFLVVEPQGARAKENLHNLKIIMGANVKRTGENSVSINLNVDDLPDEKKSGKVSDDDFRTVELILSFSSALDFDEKNKKKSEVELFASKMETVCSSLKEGKKSGRGFFWDYYAPYFIEMKDKKLLETFSYIAYASSEKEDVLKWFKDHKKETDEFFKWSESFDWLKG